MNTANTAPKIHVQILGIGVNGAGRSALLLKPIAAAIATPEIASKVPLRTRCVAHNTNIRPLRHAEPVMNPSSPSSSLCRRIDSVRSSTTPRAVAVVTVSSAPKRIERAITGQCG